MLSGGVRDPSRMNADAHRAMMIGLDPRLDPYRLADLGRGPQSISWPLEGGNDAVALDLEFAAVIRPDCFDHNRLVRVRCCCGGLVSKRTLHNSPADEVGKKQCDNQTCVVTIERPQRRELCG